jgi:hypothetical protein
MRFRRDDQILSALLPNSNDRTRAPSCDFPCTRLIEVASVDAIESRPSTNISEPDASQGRTGAAVAGLEFRVAQG